MKSLSQRISDLEVRSDLTKASTSDIGATNDAIARVWHRLRFGEQDPPSTPAAVIAQQRRTQRAIESIQKNRRRSAPSAADQ